MAKTLRLTKPVAPFWHTIGEVHSSDPGLQQKNAPQTLVRTVLAAFAM